MKRIWLRTLLFAAPVLVVLGLFERTLRRIPNDYSYKQWFWKHRANDIHVLVLGSSHCYYGVDPAYFRDKGFNASHISQSIDLDHALFAANADGLDSLSYVVVPVSYATLFARLERGIERWRIKNYVIYYDLPLSWAPSDHLELMNGTVLSQIDRVNAYRNDHRSERSCSDLGAGHWPPGVHQNDLAATGAEAAARHTMEDRSLLPENLGHLKAIIALARKKHARILLFTPPAFRTYRAHMNAEQWRTAQAAVRTLLDGPDIQYHDLLAAPAFDAPDFQDADHLNSTGARKLSLMLDSLMQHDPQ